MRLVYAASIAALIGCGGVATVYAAPLIKPGDFLAAGYTPKLPPTYRFPLVKQSLNACYFCAARNILKKKYNLGLHISVIEKAIGKDPKTLSTPKDQKNFLNAIHIKVTESTNIATLFDSLKTGEPVAISYMLSL